MATSIQRARRNTFNQAVKSNIYELDLAIWRSLKNVARKQPDLAVSQFQITSEMAQQLAQTNEENLSELPLDVIISFKLDNSEKEIVDYLTQSDHPDRPEINISTVKLNKQYWLTVHQTAKHHLYTAHLRFGISLELAKIIEKTNIKQLKQLARSIPLRFSLRYKAEYIQDTFCKKLFSILTLSHGHA